MIATIFLNKTNSKVALPLLELFFKVNVLAGTGSGHICSAGIQFFRKITYFLNPDTVCFLVYASESSFFLLPFGTVSGSELYGIFWISQFGSSK